MEMNFLNYLFANGNNYKKFIFNLISIGWS